MCRFEDLAQFVNQEILPDLDRDIEWYRNAAGREKRAFFWKSRMVRWSGGLAALFLVFSALRLDHLIEAFVNHAFGVLSGQAELGQVLNALGFLFGFLAFWMARGLMERGHLRAWIRFAVTAQTLTSLRGEVRQVIAAADLEKLPGEAVTDIEQKKVAESVFEVVARIRSASTTEINQWAKEAPMDLTAFVETARDANAISRKALTIEQPQGGSTKASL